MAASSNKPRNKWIYYLIIVCVLAIVIPGRRGLLNLFRLNRKAYQLRQEIKQLELEKARLEKEIEALGDPEVIEQIAREKYGMAKKDEKIYRIVPKEQQ